MAFRVDVTEDGTIEIQRFDRGEWHHTPFKSLEAAFIVMKLLTTRDLAQSRAERFEPQFVKEARRAFNQLSERSPHNAKRQAV